MQVDRNGLEILDRKECLRLLSTAVIGRIGLSVEALPVVLPTNFCLVDEQILLLTGAGTKLDAATVNAVVAFEVDAFDLFAHTGWSVLVTGTAREVAGRRKQATLARAHIPRWVPSGGGRLVEVDTERISGRRITYFDEPTLIDAT